MVILVGEELIALKFKVYTMSSKSSYSILLSEHPQSVSRRLPPKLDPKNSNERLHYITEDPLSILFGLTEMNSPHFVESKKLFDNDRIFLNDKIQNSNFKNEAKNRYPNLRPRKAFDTYALEVFGTPHSQVIAQAKSNLMKRFEKNFFELNSESIELDRPAAFLRTPLSCEQWVIREFEELAKQGHIFSQFMAGLLLTTLAGKFHGRGVPYLITAYENRFPRSMDALAEYLLHKEDYLGAIQSCLLSIHSLDDSKPTMRRILQHIDGRFIESPMMPLATYIFQHALDNDFIELAKKYFPEFYPSKEELKKRMLQRLLGVKD